MRSAEARSLAAGTGRQAARLVAAAASLALGACVSAPPRRPEPPEPALRIWAPGLVHWTGGRREVALAIENGTDRTVAVETPDPRRVRIAIFPDSGPDRVCGLDPEASDDPGDPVSVAPGDAVAVRVDLARACGRLPPGEYRYELGYEAPAVGKGPPVRLRTRHGHVVVEAAPPALERGSLGSGGAPASP